MERIVLSKSSVQELLSLQNRRDTYQITCIWVSWMFEYLL